MIGIRWRKVVRELWSNRARTVLVILSIAVGIFAVGTVQLLRSVILTELETIYAASNASQATLFVSEVDEAQIDALRRMPELADAQGRSSLAVKVQTGPDQWENLALVALDDFEDIRINHIDPVYSVSGKAGLRAEQTAWPTDDQIVIERSGFSSAKALPQGLKVGDALTLKDAEDRLRNVALSGVVYDPSGFPSTFTGQATGYVTLETLDHLGGSRNYDQILLRVAGSPEQQLDLEYITRIANDAADKVERAGYTVRRVQVPEPGKLPLQDLFDALGLLLTPLGLLALLLSGFLVINTISALMAQQVRQIGVMKAIGARRYQVAGIYIGAVLIYSVAALAVAVPLTVLAAGGIAGFLGGFINVEFPRWTLSTNVLAIQLVVGLLVPLLAALVPVAKGTSITVREAVSDFGTNAEQVRDGWLTRAINSVRGLSRPMQLSLRNTFRRRGRLALTLITLVLGGMLFMTVGSVRSSLDGLIETALDYYQFDVQIQFERPYRTARVEEVARSLPGVAVVEGWLGAQTTIQRSDGMEGDTLTLTALQADSVMVKPTLMEGRWLQPDDKNSIVISQNVLSAEPGLGVGDTLMLEIGEKDYPWTVVGVAQVLGGPPNVDSGLCGLFLLLAADSGRESGVQP
ncbi:MAG: ABC transporter permease [Anaerolineales bacterium]|nr:ABC transporter permease [Anaerolineales bacterium]